MRIINVPKSSGKSSNLLKYANDNGYAIIVSSVAKKNKMKEEILHNRYYNVCVYTVREFLHGLNGAKFSKDDKLCIDDVEDVLQELIGFEIDTATCSIPYTGMGESLDNGKVEES